MNIYITNEELREIEELVEEYKLFEGDSSYLQHLYDYLIQLMIKKGVIKE